MSIEVKGEEAGGVAGSRKLISDVTRERKKGWGKKNQLLRGGAFWITGGGKGGLKGGSEPAEEESFVELRYGERTGSEGGRRL